ncbi:MULTISPECIES: PTS sugar transporter subunit IIC [unclassified Enterococcus]|uniref:PTS sugar transporter subunit IIC n=1 Tax=unclassified Enterococcus TaxID=2608891 RepID=UPI001908EE2C|nr:MULTISPECIES: PTS transporter subunit EIIC [unclassified Enterococcus]MBK0036057.1 PTS sugar transporter subunit IIC [Enterococcus sp. S52]MBK0068715.1 PTS sugar transporter subunit IIC [Enterococcus sp. S53]MBK0139308.1 PTS sugar transporter subunit IIC [Enterococcus sp. S76]MBK0142943.1 PTS sugar transporter subunit IIC [Enterococcus sp. S77]
MKKFMNWLSNSFAPTMNSLFSRPWLSAISTSMQKIIPFILTGSVIYLYNVIVSFVPVLPDLSPILNYSFGLITMVIAFTVANQAMEKLKHGAYSTVAGIVAICVLLMVVMPNSDDTEALSTLLTNLGPTGIAVGIIVGLYVAVIFNLWAKLKFLKDSSIPDFVTGWINNIIPIFLSLGIAMVLVTYFNLNLFSLILGLFQPLAAIGQSFPGFVLMCAIPVFFYTLGVSTWLWSAVTLPIYLSGIQANIDAVAAGNPAMYIATNETVFTLGFITMGGTAATLGLNVLMCFSKSRQLKILGRVFIIPSIFNINEPVAFGAPIVFNPLLMVPAWINGIVGPTYVWILMKSGLLNIPSQLLFVGQIPAPFSSWLVTDDLRAFLWWAVLFALYLLIWYPFFKVYEKQKIQEELVQDTAVEG